MTISIFAVAILLGFAGVASAQTKSVRAGALQPAGVSHGGSFTVRGSVKTPQVPAPGSGVSASRYRVTDGLLGIWIMQSESSPRLRVQRIGTTGIRLYWPAPATGYRLEFCRDLRHPQWTPAPETPANDGAWFSVDISAPGRSIYYRLGR